MKTMRNLFNEKKDASTGDAGTSCNQAVPAMPSASNETFGNYHTGFWMMGCCRLCDCMSWALS